MNEKMNENREITAEDLDGVAGGRIRYYIPMFENPAVCKYGGPDMYRPKPTPKPLTPEEQKKLEEGRKKKEQEQKKALEKNIENPEIN